MALYTTTVGRYIADTHAELPTTCAMYSAGHCIEHARDEFWNGSAWVASGGGGGTSDHALLTNVTASQHHSNANDHANTEGAHSWHGAHHTSFVQADHDALPNPHHAQAHATAHQPGGGDAMAVDAAAGTGSLRTLGAGATQAAAGDHTHGGGGWTTVVKTADESHNNSATVADDTVLQFNTVANTQYTIRLLALFLTNATADLKYRLVHTGTTTRVRRRVRRTSTTDIAQIYELKTAFDSADVVLSTTGLNPNLSEEIIVQVGASGGVLKLQWGQVTSNAGPTTCLEGSYLEYAAA